MTSTILNKNYDKPIDKAKYEAKVGCFNCDAIELILIKKGTQVDEWIKNEKVKCPNCECIETLQSWKQYLAGRAMVTQIVELSKKEEDIEAKKMDHIG